MPEVCWAVDPSTGMTTSLSSGPDPFVDQRRVSDSHGRFEDEVRQEWAAQLLDRLALLMSALVISFPWLDWRVGLVESSVAL